VIALTNFFLNQPVIEDTIIAVPSEAKSLVASYCQEVNTKAWEEYGKGLRESQTKRGGNWWARV